MSFTVSRLAYSDSASGSNTVLTTGAAVQTGTFLAVIVSSSGTNPTLGVSDSKGNTYTQRVFASQDVSPSSDAAIFTTAVGGITTALTSTDTITATSTAGSGAGDIMLLKITVGVGSTIALGLTSTGVGNNTSPAVTSFSPPAGDLVINAVCQANAALNTNFTPGTGYTKLAGGDAHTQTRSVVGQYRISAGATTAPATVTPTNPWASVALALHETAPASSSFVNEFARGSYNGTTTKTLTGVNAVPVTNAVAAGDLAVLVVDCPAGGGANTTFTVTDTKGNTWTQRALVVQTTTGGNGQVAIMGSILTTALTTSDTLTVTVNNFGAIIWCWIGMHFTGITSFDVAATNVGASSSTLSSGTTAAGAQDVEMVLGAFGYTGTGVSLTSLTPSGFTSQPIQSTTGTIRNLGVVWGFTNAPGTRSVGAHMSDASSHAWCGAVGAWRANVTVPDTTVWYLPDGFGSWDGAEMLIYDGAWT
jgi:hypothetical protein